MLIRKFDQLLLNLAWSLWTELGVQGTARRHSDVLIDLEELIIFTSQLVEIDPRLRDESMDWCSQYHRFVSVSRLKSIIEESAKESFSQYAATVNAMVKANWPIYEEKAPQHIRLSRKSCLRPLESPALLGIRLRAIFSVGSRADLITFFLTSKNSEHSILETAQIGYSKRNLADVLEELHLAGLLERLTQGNQLRYRLNDRLLKTIQPIPSRAPNWHMIFKLLIALRACMQRMESKAESSQAVEISACLDQNKEILQRLHIKPPVFKKDFRMFVRDFEQWALGIAAEFEPG